MRKSILFIAATALIMVSCSDVETLKKDVQNNNIEGETISFSSYAQKITRAENSGANYNWGFYNHQGSFKVWAYKNPNNVYSDQVFDGVVIDATRSENTPYTYSFVYHVAAQARFWDKAASNYEFYAAAPADGSNEENGDWQFKTTSIVNYATQDKGYFETTSTLSGVNLRAATSDATKYTSLAEERSSFKGTNDIDKLIAAPCSGNYKTFIDPNDNTKHVVQLNFIHILSKLNVTVKKDADLDSKEVKLLSIEFFNLKNKGNFSESTDAAPAGSYGRWSSQAKVQVSNQDVVYSYVSADGDDEGDQPDGVILSKEANERIYFIESLVIPQATETENIDYDGTVTPAVLYADLADYNETNDPDIDQDAFDNLSPAEMIKTPAVKVSGTSKPYFVITYTIDGELYESYHNLANSFKKSGENTLDFYEGFQNTLNINIKPEKIEFTADVAAWDDNEKVENADLD